MALLVIVLLLLSLFLTITGVTLIAVAHFANTPEARPWGIGCLCAVGGLIAWVFSGGGNGP